MLVTRAQQLRYREPVQRIVLVFDGDASEGTVRQAQRGKVSVVFASPDADSYLQAYVRKDPHPETVLVISDDRAVRDTARACRARCMGAGEFLKATAPSRSSGARSQPERTALDAHTARRITDELKRHWHVE